MARHRNVRGYNYDEDFEEDDLYGHSVEDDYCISPSTAAQFIYSRRDNPSALTETLEEEYGYEDKEHHNCISSHELTGVEKAQLETCLKHMREVLQDSVPEQVMVEAVLNSKFSVQQALDSVLAQGNNQNMKTKDNVIAGKAAKGLFCSEIYSNDHRLSDLVENTSDSTTACFNLSDPIVRFGPSAASDKIQPRSKYVKTPSVKKQTLSSSSKYLGVPPLPVSDSDRVFHDSVNKHTSLPLVGDSRTTPWRSVHESGLLPSSGDEVMKDNASERSSWNQSEYEDIQDFKTLFRLNETGDAADAPDRASVCLQNKSDGSNCCLDSPPGLISALRDTMLHNKMSNTFTGKMGHFENACSVSQKKSSPQGHNCSFSEFDSLMHPFPESPSLADLLQEHQSRNSDKTYPLSDQYNPPVASITDMELGYSPLSQLAGLPQVSSGMAELSGSLSSLTFSRSSPIKELESLSLSDLIANSIEVAKPAAVSNSELSVAKMMQPPGVNSDIDLSVLIRKSALSDHGEVKSDSQLPETEVSCPVQEQQILVAKGVKKSKKRVRPHILEGTVPWTKTLSARPSSFAITLCLHYPPKRCKRGTVSLHEAFLYSRQMQEVKINETGPLLTITPFDFKSPSPDDIVKAGQKKAFTR